MWFRSCDNTLKNCFFQIFSYPYAYVGILAKGEAGNSFENWHGYSIHVKEVSLPIVKNLWFNCCLFCFTLNFFLLVPHHSLLRNTMWIKSSSPEIWIKVTGSSLQFLCFGEYVLPEKQMVLINLYKTSVPLCVNIFFWLRFLTTLFRIGNLQSSQFYKRNTGVQTFNLM